MLILVIAPVAAAVDHYSDIANMLSSTQGMERVGSSCSLNADVAQTQQHHSHMAGCHFHNCVACAIAPSAWVPQAYSPSHYGYLEKSIPASFLIAPDIRPPIRRI